MTIKIATARIEETAQLANLSQDLRTGMGEDTPVLIVVFASVNHPLDQALKSVRGSFPGVTVIGSTTAGEFVGAREGKGTLVAWAIGGQGVSAAAGMSGGMRLDLAGAVSKAIPHLPASPDRPHRTAIILVDPLTGMAEEAIWAVAEKLGPEVTVAGGAASDDISFDRTLVGLDGACKADALVVALIDTVLAPSVGVMHGHMPITQWMSVTKAHGAELQEIDGKPAFHVWKESVRKKLTAEGLDVDKIPVSELGSHLLRYEVGVPGEGSEVRIRAPLKVGPRDSLSLACAIPVGSKIRIMESSVSSQALSAQQAAFRARQGIGRGGIAGALVFDCICRKLIMGDQFSGALQSIQDSLRGCPMAGFKTYGEIARIKGEAANFHQTTSVVLAFPG